MAKISNNQPAPILSDSDLKKSADIKEIELEIMKDNGLNRKADNDGAKK